MSIIRLSVIRDEIFAPQKSGDLETNSYSRRQNRGRMAQKVKEGVLPSGKWDLAHYLSKGLQEEASEVNGPIIAMIHGFLFDPEKAVHSRPEMTDNPHGRLYHFQHVDYAKDCKHHITSWPLGLGLREGDKGQNGLALGFGWHSLPGMARSLLKHFQNYYQRAYQNAQEAAWALINSLLITSESLPGRNLNLFCHSLGSRVIIRGLSTAAKLLLDEDAQLNLKPSEKDRLKRLLERIDRVMILGGAEYSFEAQVLNRRLHALGLNENSGPEFFNFVSRENYVLDALAENFGTDGFGRNTSVIGHNGLDLIRSRAPRWIDLQIDSPALQKWVRKEFDISISGDNPNSVWDHWHYYTFPGNMEFYNRLLRAERKETNIEALRGMGIPERVTRDHAD